MTRVTTKPKTPVIETGVPITFDPATYALVAEYVENRDTIAGIKAYKSKLSLKLLELVEKNDGKFVHGDTAVRARRVEAHVKRTPNYTALKDRYPETFARHSSPNRALKIVGMSYDYTAPPWPKGLAAIMLGYEESKDELRARTARQAELTAQLKARIDSADDDPDPDTATHLGAWKFTDGVTVRLQNAARSIDWDAVKAQHPEQYDDVLAEVKVSAYSIPVRSDLDHDPDDDL